MSKYYEQLVEHIESNPEWIQPDIRREDLLARLKKEPLRDLSCSRATFSWGVPVPGNERHVMCVSIIPAYCT